MTAVAVLGVTVSQVSIAQQAQPQAVSVTSIQPGPQIRIWPGVAPGSEKWRQIEIEHKYRQGAGRIIRNVVIPTLIPYLPDPRTATGAAVIVAPGGAFTHLSIENEGRLVANWLAQRGLAAFVLKYRLSETPADTAEFQRNEIAAATRRGADTANNDPPKSFDASAFGIADGVAALRLVRRRAIEWQIDPNRVGIVGFSAGGRVAAGMLMQDNPADRPNFAAPIYGGVFGASHLTVPRDLPPVFLATAMDDFAMPTVLDLFDALRASGSTPELHIFAEGGHGFGMTQQGKTSDNWAQDFYWWMKASGLLDPRGMSLSLDSTVKQWLANQRGRAILERHVPALLTSSALAQASGLPLRTLARFAPDQLTPATMEAIEQELNAP